MTIDTKLNSLFTSNSPADVKDHDKILQKFQNYKKGVHDVLDKITPSYIIFFNI